jgi:hypothetical protein
MIFFKTPKKHFPQKIPGELPPELYLHAKPPDGDGGIVGAPPRKGTKALTLPGNRHRNHINKRLTAA